MEHEEHFDFYAAGPFFNKAQVASMEGMEEVLEAHGKTLFKPRKHEHRGTGPAACFADDVEGIAASDAVIANLVDGDTGTMWEIGYAYALGKPVYGYLDGLRPGERVNLMITQSVRAIFASREALARFLETGEAEELELAEF